MQTEKEEPTYWRYVPENYGYVFVRPVNWDYGTMDELDAMSLSRRSECRNYLIVWESRTEKVGYKNGARLWRKKLTDTK